MHMYMYMYVVWCSCYKGVLLCVCIVIKICDKINIISLHFNKTNHQQNKTKQNQPTNKQTNNIHSGGRWNMISFPGEPQ